MKLTGVLEVLLGELVRAQRTRHYRRCSYTRVHLNVNYWASLEHNFVQLGKSTD